MEGFEHVGRVAVGGPALLINQSLLVLPGVGMEGGSKESLGQRGLQPTQHLESI